MLILGLAIRFIMLPLMVVMLVAAFLVHWDNGWLVLSDASSWLANDRVMEAAEKKAREEAAAKKAAAEKKIREEVAKRKADAEKRARDAQAALINELRAIRRDINSLRSDVDRLQAAANPPKKKSAPKKKPEPKKEEKK